MSSATRRERLRAATTDEITEAATALLAEHGAAGLSLRAVARSVQMAPSALYRYFPNRDALLTTLIIQAYDALGEQVESAIAARGAGDPIDALLRAVHAFRDWSLAHPQRFALIFGSPVPGYHAPDATRAPAMRTPTALLLLLQRCWHDSDLLHGSPQAREHRPPLSKSLQQQLTIVLTVSDLDLPPALLARALQFWSLLLGLVAAEAFGHLPGPVTHGPSHEFFDLSCRGGLIAMGFPADAVDAAHRAAAG